MTATGSLNQPLTGDVRVDALFTLVKWNSTAIDYNFPTTATYYPVNYGGANDEPSGFVAVSDNFKAMVRKALSHFEAVTLLDFTEVAAGDASNTSIARTSQLGGGNGKQFDGYAYAPGTSARAGDVWFSNLTSDISDNYPFALGRGTFQIVLHEFGHSVGLKHPHQQGGNTLVMPAEFDFLDYTVMAYRRFEGGPTSGHDSEPYGRPQSLMMLDILALQTMYGANYGHNSGNTVYSWSPATGQMFVNGVGGDIPGNGNAGANRIYATLWDGGGNDTYNLSNYTTNLNVDLNPGGKSIFSETQLAIVHQGDNIRATANLFNALLYQNDTRSLIENVWSGSGNDTFTLYDYNVNNFIDGNNGTDHVLLTYTFNSGYIVQSGSTASNLIISGSQGIDVFYDVEWFNFNGSWVSASDLAATAFVEYDFYWWDPNGSGDFYYGTVYDNGTYGYQVGQTWNGPWSTTEASGNNGYYYIYSSHATTGDHSAGEVWTRDYYDSSSASTLNTYNEVNGSVSGWSGLGSEYDWIVNWEGQYDGFGQDYWQANYYPTAYHFYWWDPYGSGDYYYGTVYDNGTYGYQVGQTWNGPYSGTEGGSNDGYYYIYDSSSGSAGHYTGEIQTYDYYDWSSGFTFNTYHEVNGSVSGWYGFGSEYDWIVNWNGGYDDFGLDFYRADYYPTAYDFYWWDPNGSGDYYYGTVYDDGTYGYDVGETWTGPWSNTEGGNNDGYYYIYDSGGAFAPAYVGEVHTYDYYDYQSGFSLNTFNEVNGSASGWYGLGSEYDWIQQANGAYDDFGRDYYLANYI